jgi:hypothetical protein
MTIFAALAVAAVGWSLPTQAAPVSGSAVLDIVFTPDPTTYAPTGTKIDKILVKLELDLILTLSVSGVDITSQSVFTFRGLEYQSFVFIGTIGALVARSQFIFAPNIIEIEVVRDVIGLPAYCVNLADPALTDPYGWNCGTPVDAGEHLLYLLIEGSDLFLTNVQYMHPAIRNLFLAAYMEAQPTDPLGQTLTFRKKTVDLGLSLAGLTIGLRGMFANLGSAMTPDWNMGIVASVEGQTVSGITIRGESWIGAKQGLECFAECKPLQIVRGGKVIDEFVFTEEKLFIRNLKIAGVTFGARLEFQFADVPVGLQFVELTQSFRLDPFRLEVHNTINVIGPDLTLLSDTFVTSLKVGDVAVTVVGYIWPSFTGAFNLYWSRVISVFDPPGMKVTSDLQFCNEELTCTGALFFHDLRLSATVGDMSIDIGLRLTSVLTGFVGATVDLAWKVGNVTLKSATILTTNSLLAQLFSIGFTF